MIGLLATIVLIAILWVVVKYSKRPLDDNLPPSPADRRATWAGKYFRMPEHMRNPPTRFTPPVGTEDWSARQILKRMKDRPTCPVQTEMQE